MSCSYNVVHGSDEDLAEVDKLLRLADIQDLDIPRFREAAMSENGQFVKIMTRTGGCGYKEDNALMKTHRNYSHKKECWFDETYIWWYFHVEVDEEENR